MDGDLPEDNSSSVGASLSETTCSFPLLQTTGCLARIHHFQVQGFFLPRTTTDDSHVASVQRELVTPASVSLAPLASFPSLDANGGIDLQVFDAPDCSTLQLLRVDQMRKGESKEF